jgi:inward rectifier potassium channel
MAVHPAPPRPVRPPQDLGFGSVVTGATRRRFLNRDGTFNVRRTGLGLLESRSFYRYLLDISWSRFLVQVVYWYLAINAIFAVAYLACGPGALDGPEDYGVGWIGHFLSAYFFSVQTLATIGYGRISPVGIPANLIVAVESVVGLVTFALITGIAFARFSRPRPKIRFSDRAIVAPYEGITALMFRLANTRDSELFDMAAEVSMTRRRTGGTVNERMFGTLALERPSVTFLPLSWTVVHPIDAASPLYGVSREELLESEAEFVVRLTAYDDTTAQTVHVRTSYKADEVLWGVRFVNIIEREHADGIIRVDVTRINETEPAALPSRGQLGAGSESALDLPGPSLA